MSVIVPVDVVSWDDALWTSDDTSLQLGCCFSFALPNELAAPAWWSLCNIHYQQSRRAVHVSVWLYPMAWAAVGELVHSCSPLWSVVISRVLALAQVDFPNQRSSVSMYQRVLGTRRSSVPTADRNRETWHQVTKKTDFPQGFWCSTVHFTSLRVFPCPFDRLFYCAFSSTGL